MISDDRRDKALRYLAETDEVCADLKTDLARAEYRMKSVKDTVFLHSEGTVAERQAHSGTHDDYTKSLLAYFESLQKYEAMKNKRATEVLVIDCWRSENANRRVGNV